MAWSRNIAGFSLIATLLLAGAGCGPHGSEIPIPKATQGLLDLRGWNFQKDGPIRLDGDWEFYWDHLLSARDFHAGSNSILTRSGYFHIPHSWTGERLDGRELPMSGYATFRLRVLLDPQEPPLGVSLEGAGTAYTLTVNGEPVISLGQVGTSPGSSHPEYGQRISVLKALGTESE